MYIYIYTYFSILIYCINVEVYYNMHTNAHVQIKRIATIKGVKTTAGQQKLYNIDNR